jgi:putative nucleotidyltransferase with HDIG domain
VGDWEKLSDSWLNPLGNITNMISSTGQTELKNGCLTVSATLITRQSPQTKVLAYTPLFYNSYNLGSIWIGHRSRLTAHELMIFKSMGDVLAQAIYCLSPDRQKEAISLVTIQSLVDILAAWDIPTYQHSLRLISSVRATARRLGCSENQIQTIGWAALLHDIGKICIPKDILYKAGGLSAEEWGVIRQHPGYGARILAPVDKLKPVSAIILAHHEKFDGSGYPYRLSEQRIPLGARILSVVDAYSAMTDGRVYRQAISHEDALIELRRCAGTHFDPLVVDAFIQLFS